MIFVVYTKENSNYMKKSKIIVPALGLLLLSTAASVSGTVAWFTATRYFNTTAGNFAVVKTNTDLACDMAGVVGTKVNGSGATATIGLKDDYVELTDASFDHVNSYVIAPNASGENIGKSTALTSATEETILRSSYVDSESHTHNVYSAVVWTMDFNVHYTVADADNGLYINVGSQFTQPDGTALAATDAGKGFRLAFIPMTESGDTDNVYETGLTRVFAGARTASETPTYIQNAAVGTALTPASYISPALCCSDDLAALPDDGAVTYATAQGYKYCLGKFTATAGKTMHLKYRVVGWFEGTDDNVDNEGALAHLVKATLNFEIRSLKAAS